MLVFFTDRETCTVSLVVNIIIVLTLALWLIAALFYSTDCLYYYARRVVYAINVAYQ